MSQFTSDPSARRIELDAFELDRAAYVSITRRELFRRYRNWFLPGVALLLVLLARIAWGATSVVGFLIASAPTFLFIALWFWLASSWLPRYMSRHPMNRFQFGRYRVVLAGGRLEVERSGGTSWVAPLDQIVDAGRPEGYLVLYVSMGDALMIPRTAFRSVEDEAAFEAAVSQGVKDSQPKPGPSGGHR